MTKAMAASDTERTATECQETRNGIQLGANPVVGTIRRAT